VQDSTAPGTPPKAAWLRECGAGKRSLPPGAVVCCAAGCGREKWVQQKSGAFLLHKRVFYGE
jgi:hypothetical protein